MKLFIVLFIFLFSTSVFAQSFNSNDVFLGINSQTNYVKNPWAKDNGLYATASNATIVRGTTNKLYSLASWTCDASAQNGYCDFTLKTIQNPDANGNCELKGVVYGDSSLYRAQILDNSAVVKAQTAALVYSSTTVWNQFSVNFPCQSTPKVRITQTEAGTAPAISLGLYYGPATNLSGGVPPNTFTAFLDPSSGALRQTPSQWVTCGNSGSSGDVGYSCLFNGPMSGLSTIPNCDFKVVDGSGVVNEDRIGALSTTSLTIFSNTTTTYARIGGLLTCTKTGADNIQPAITAQNFDTDWITCPSISGSWTGGTYSCKYMHQGPNTHYDISFVASGAPSGSTLTFTLPFTIDTAKMNNPVATFTSLMGGDATLEDNSSSGGYKLYAVYNSPTSILMAYQSSNVAAGSGVTPTSPITIANLDKINVKFSVPTVGRSVSQGAPQLVGSVTSNFNGALRFEYLSVESDCTASPCTISKNSGAFTSVTRVSTGNYSVNYPAGTWPSPPVCTFSTNNPEALFGSWPSATSVGLVTKNSSGTNSDGAFAIHCVGPR